MAKTATTTASSSPRNNLVAAVMAVVMLFCLGACAPERSPYSEFRTLTDEGWFSSMPLKFSPQLVDSTVQTCNVEVAVRHNNSYPYSSLNLVVDFIDSRYRVVRHNVVIPVANGYGNWLGSGFGRFYQEKVTVAEGVAPASLHSIVVWQAMKGCEKITDVENVGIIITPVNY